MKYEPEKWARGERMKKGQEPNPFVQITKSVAVSYGKSARDSRHVLVGALKDWDLIGVFKSHESMLATATERMLQLRGKQLKGREPKLEKERYLLQRRIPYLRCCLLAIEQEIARRPSTSTQKEP